MEDTCFGMSSVLDPTFVHRLTNRVSVSQLLVLRLVIILGVLII